MEFETSQTRSVQNADELKEKIYIKEITKIMDQNDPLIFERIQEVN